MQTTEVANYGVLTGPIAVQRTKTCGTLHSMSSMSCLTEDKNSILDTSGSVSHTSSYLITSNPGVDNEGNTPCNSREAIQGEEQLYYPTEAATTRHHVLAWPWVTDNGHGPGGVDWTTSPWTSWEPPGSLVLPEMIILTTLPKQWGFESC
ncbi:hypothetical protein THAOC_09942 [Thalassiosira oceanica]|uniref:Uncharacterized protein n=1 Tax=Thalassiosira oceanica TaxID=159749 RepID=K0T6A8_THAOC|nr:hypothetical protein THAOC_09942 [Thalassiosira oceanica]|eukprot:EJK68846.1 hypothetical protein THAOC_09942 [Thalassiosira oceanica]